MKREVGPSGEIVGLLKGWKPTGHGGSASLASGRTGGSGIEGKEMYGAAYCKERRADMSSVLKQGKSDYTFRGRKDI